MSECLTREEVEQALGSSKRNQPWEVMDKQQRWSAAMCWWTFGTTSSIGAGGMGGFFLRGGKV